MGQNASHDRSAKHRQSTRSLPDAALHRLDISDAQQWAAYANGGLKRTTNHHSTKENAGVLCAKNNTTCGNGYEQNVENFQRNWSKAAAPYYAPSDNVAAGKRTAVSARSYDGNYRKTHHVESDRLERKGPFRHDESADNDNWSDVASDMYRLRRHQASMTRGSSSSHRNDVVSRQEDIREESKSDFAAPSIKQHKSSNRKYRRGGSECNMPLTRVPENSSADNHVTEPLTRNRYSSNRYSTRSNTATPATSNTNIQKQHYDHVTNGDGSQSEFESAKSSSKRSKSVQDFRRPKLPPVGADAVPARPPKNAHYYAMLENPVEEKWVDYPTRNSKVKFESSSAVAASSPSSDYSSPKSPTSNECEKLIIQSLRAELNAERLKRVELERKSKKEHIELETLKRTVDALESQVQLLTSSLQETERSPRHDKTTAELKEVCTQLTAHIKQLEDEKNRLVLDGQQQKAAYERCLTEAAERVARAVISDKALQSECTKLHNIIFELEFKNKMLSSEMETLSKKLLSQRFTSAQMFSHFQEPTSSTPPYSNKWSPATSIISQSKGNNNNNNNNNIPVFPMMAMANVSATSVESIASFNDHNMLVVDNAVVTTSPMSNGGEALCSRPTSFNFDAVYSLSSNVYHNIQQQQQQQLQKVDSNSDSYNDCPEMPRNYAVEIDDPYQQNSTRKSRREHPLLNSSSISAANQNLIASAGDSPVKRRRTPSISDDTAGSNETLCPSTAEQPPPSQTKREIVVNMIRTTTTNLNPDIFRRAAALLPRNKFPPGVTIMDQKFSPADDGYSTMSSCNYVLEALLSSKLNFVGKSNSLRYNIDSSFTSNTVRSFDNNNKLKRVLSDQTILLIGAEKKRLPILQKSYSDSKLYINVSKTKKELLSKNHRYPGITAFDKECTLLFDVLSSRNDLTEFERDMLLEDEFKQQREGLFELNEEAKSDLLKRDICDPFVLQHSDQTTNVKEKSATTVLPIVSQTEIVKQDSDLDKCCVPEAEMNISPPAPAPAPAPAPPPLPPHRSSSPKKHISSIKPVLKNKPKSKKIMPLRQDLNDSSTTSSYTSDDSEDDGATTMKEWLKQLKIRKAQGKMAVVRYLPPDQRPSILRRDVFYRFGKQERKALTSFDFLYRSSTCCSPAMVDGSKPKNFARRHPLSNNSQVRRILMNKRKSGSFSDICCQATTTTTNSFVTGDDYENLPYHRLARTLSADDLQASLDLKHHGRHRMSSSEDHWQNLTSSASSSLDERSDSYGSSLFLSDLCVADRTISSSSSLSFTTF